jgi:amidohydrolase
MRDFRAEAEALRDEMVARRRDLHQYPELGFEVVRTAGIVASTLQELGLEVQTGVGKTGVVGVLEGSVDGPTVLVRCDMDALPVEEENEFEYRSLVPGKMHACGHDAHTSIGLAVARMLHDQRDRIKGRVKFIFQPAEEIGLGAQAMIDDGALKTPEAQVSFGLHMWPEIPVGEIVLTPGPLMAGVSFFQITLEGRGGHGARPYRTIDPIIAAAQLTVSLQSIVSRNMDPNDAVVFSVTRIAAGETYNVIPNRAELRGTFRTFTPEAHSRLVERFQTIIEHTAAAFECTATVELREAAPPLVNDAEIAARLRAPLADLGFGLHEPFRSMEGEDMALILEKVPGVFFFVGCGTSYPLHHPRFHIDEEAMVVGASLLASVVSDYVL